MTQAQVQAAPVKPARILFVLDRSGSMQSMKNDTIGGFNSFVADQRKLEARTTFTLAQFDDQYEVVYDGIDIKEVRDLNESTFVPRGGTALYDAIGRTVAQHRGVNEEGVLTILGILTDGEENQSREYSYPAVQALLKEVQDQLGWEVYFLGANINAQNVGATLGVKGTGTMTFAASAKGVQDAYRSVGIMASSSRGFVSSDTAELLGAAVGASGEVDAQLLYNAVSKLKPDDKKDKDGKPSSEPKP